jgi:hypothetical protein
LRQLVPAHLREAARCAPRARSDRRPRAAPRRRTPARHERLGRTARTSGEAPCDDHRMGPDCSTDHHRTVPGTSQPIHLPGPPIPRELDRSRSIGGLR